MKNVIIRTATSADKAELLALEQKVVEAERPYNASIKPVNAVYYDINRLLSADDSNLIVAVCNGVIIGTGYGQIRESKTSLIHSLHTYLGFMYVEIEYRGLGINKLIMENLINWSKSRGVFDLYLDVYDVNDAAIRAYKKLGFTKTLVEMKINLSD